METLNAAWQEAFEERAAIMEYEGKLPRKEAEVRAKRTMSAPLPPPERTSRQYLAFREFWHSPVTKNRS